jgi:hypothetical protein
MLIMYIIALLSRSDEGSGSLRWVFSLRELRSATNSFNYDNKIGEGPLGSVYWGQVWDGSQVSAPYIFTLAVNLTFNFVACHFSPSHSYFTHANILSVPISLNNRTITYTSFLFVLGH